jgi:hypothetical protein
MPSAKKGRQVKMSIQPKQTFRRHPVHVCLSGFRQVAVALALVAGGTAAAPAQIVRYMNGPLTPAAVDRKGAITAIVFPDLTPLGEPGVILPRLGLHEFPDSIFTVLSGRPNQYGHVYWDEYLDDFHVRIYSADPATGYLAGAPPVHELSLPLPVDAEGNPVTTVFDSTDGTSYLPDLPSYCVVSSNSDYKQNQGYFFSFRFTSSEVDAGPNRLLLPAAVLEYLRSQSVVMTFHVRSFSATNGGVRLAAQEIGNGQQLPLAQATFSTLSQPRDYSSDPAQYSYAIGFALRREEWRIPGVSHLAGNSWRVALPTLPGSGAVCQLERAWDPLFTMGRTNVFGFAASPANPAWFDDSLSAEIPRAYYRLVLEPTD